MSRLKQKLQSQSGASLILALLFFFIAATVGGLTLASASANVGRFSHLREEQQAYLTVSSAARLLRGEIVKQNFEFKEITVYQLGEQEEILSGPVMDYGEEPSGALAGILYSWAKYIFQQNNNLYGEMPPGDTFTIESAEIGTVNATIAMDANYNITINLCLQGAEDKYEMTLTALASTQPIDYSQIDNVGETETTTVGIKVSWTNIEINKGKPAQGGGGE